jgi:mitogen-activated protein kinase 1/3
VKTAVKLATVRFAGEEWSIDPKYVLFKRVGSGAYGCVAAARDTSAEAKALNDGEPVAVAVKKIANVFSDAVDARRILREVRLMRNWSHPCVLGLYDVVEPSFSTDFEDLYIVTPLLTTDLSKIIYSKTVLSEEQQLYLFYQMCCGVHYINSAGVLHRDLKPANLLVDVKTCTLKVCDFGLSRCRSRNDPGRMDVDAYAGFGDGGAPVDADGAADDVAETDFTEYVVTRWYRAPEIMLGYHRYGAPIDAWSIACIFCELVLKEPLFPGNDYLHQLKIILKQIGTPADGDDWFVRNANARSSVAAREQRKKR